MRRVIFITVLALFLSINSHAQKGIIFEEGSWAQIVAKAKSEKRPIFIDFYTQWCGPCLMMAEEVFILPEVYSFYNSNFVNAKIDAEVGEGIELAKKYGINSYPTYLFIDPVTEEPLHRSSGRQEPSLFVYTGQSALTPALRSYYLNQNWESKKGDLEFLANYAKYKGSIYDRDGVAKVMEQFSAIGKGLEEPMVWRVFIENINASDNIYFKELSNNYDKYVKLYGKEVVDAKLAKESSFAPLELLRAMPDFKGKESNIAINEINLLVREKKYNEAIAAIDAVLERLDLQKSGEVEPLLDKDKILNALRFTVRNRSGEETPTLWAKKCGEYLRYLAYNLTDRNDAMVHFEYAQYLESQIKELQKPRFGKEEYSMRPDKLKQKPRR